MALVCHADHTPSLALTPPTAWPDPHPVRPPLIARRRALACTRWTLANPADLLCLPAMDDHDFPSGPWIGFYVYSTARQNRHRMDLGLTFANGVISGEGTDDIDKFVLRGRYETKSKQVYWTKTYLGAHDVYYKGFREGRGIWGTWEIGRAERGGFHIWPLALGTDGDQANGEQVAQLVRKAQPVVSPPPRGRCATAPSA